MTHFRTIICCRCGEHFGMTEETHATLRRSSQNFQCPWGHVQHFPLGESELDKTRRERDRLKQDNARLADEARLALQERDAAKRQAASAKSSTKRLKARAAAGICPCCNRSFIALARHMKTKHPEFRAQ